MGALPSLSHVNLGIFSDFVGSYIRIIFRRSRLWIWETMTVDQCQVVAGLTQLYLQALCHFSAPTLSPHTAKYISHGHVCDAPTSVSYVQPALLATGLLTFTLQSQAW